MENKTQPSALNMPEHKKRETVSAVYEAIGILNKQEKDWREFWSETWKVTEQSTRHRIMSYKYSRKYLSGVVYLIVGSSQQRRLKRYNRQNDVWVKSLRIANKTGVNFSEVKELYFKLMFDYIDNAR